VTFTHICLLAENSVINGDSSAPNVPCKILEKETFWKVAQVVCILLVLKKIGDDLFIA